MTLMQWLAIGGFWGCFVVIYLSGVLLFTKPTYTAEDSANRRGAIAVVIGFGWIPVGAAALIIRGMIALYMRY